MYLTPWTLKGSTGRIRYGTGNQSNSKGGSKKKFVCKPLNNRTQSVTKHDRDFWNPFVYIV